MNKKYLALLLTIICIIVLGGIGYLFYSTYTENRTLKAQLVLIEAELTESKNEIAMMKKGNEELLHALQNKADENASFANLLTQATQNLNNLQWLNSLDSQVLQKYSKVYFLNENYTPKLLSRIDTKFIYDKSRPLEIHDYALPFLQDMLHAAKNDGIDILVASAYRSFIQQSSLKASYKVTYGSGANAFSADQGYSEHQLGTTIDFTTPQIGGSLSGFEKTKAYTWLEQNAYKYGFVLSYPKNNAYYIFEPWHWRFVGLDLALKLHNENKYFYDLDQNEINKYLGSIFNKTPSASSQ